MASRETSYVQDRKKRVLIVDDEVINREMLSFMLADTYDIIQATNGCEALEQVRKYQETLSLVLLDLIMPEMDGHAVLREMRQDEALRRIPVIVLTSDKASEVQSLNEGAADFITKPYDMQDVILARIRRTIELAEDKQILRETECDPLTGLLNKEFFYRYVKDCDTFHPDIPMDAIYIDVNHFRIINELYGWKRGNALLQHIAAKAQALAQQCKGLACRNYADIFLLYVPHASADYTAFLEDMTQDVTLATGAGKVRVRMGLYENVSATMQVEKRFDRAKVAADTLRDNFSATIAYYDSALQEKELLDEQLMSEMDTALAEHQFEVYYQPKFDIRGEVPRLDSAEALIRWNHPQRGLVSPGVFIPLFEHYGMIQHLDRYVWREAARQIADWRDRLGVTLPVSVNVSRVDMNAPSFTDFFAALVEEYKLSPADCKLEITESAYMDNSSRIVQIVDLLRSQGFKVEMDDFGSGYSSLNMLATLPVDALKLDMGFIRSMHKGEKNMRMVELIIDIAHYLKLPVIAEGVENEAQMRDLKRMGCDIIQGYYFSKPLPAKEFEKFFKEA